MGSGIAENLLNRKYDVTGYDINPSAVERFAAAGGKGAATVKEAAQDASALILVVFDAVQIEDVLFTQGAADVMQPGSCVIVMSSVGRKVMEEAAPRLKKKGIHLIDAPMKGSFKDAACGNLYLMVAAEPKVLAGAEALLSSLGSTVNVVGDRPGMGQMVKTCVQVFFCLACEGACEIMMLAQAAGLNTDKVFEILSSTGASSEVFKTTTRFVAGRSFSGTGNPISILKKDLNVAMDLAKDYHLTLPAISGTTQNVVQAADAYPDDDIWSAARPIEASAGVELQMHL